MATQIIWSSNALQDRLAILDYWFKRTGNKKYSIYLDTCFKEIVIVISTFPEIGRVYKNTNFRFMVKHNYLLFYEFNDTTINILAIFDTNRNPELLTEKLNY